MGYLVERLSRPYNFRVLIEAFIYTRRRDFVHEDFTNYYTDLLRTLEGLFGLRLSPDGLPFDKRVLWMLVESTTRSLLQITHPWDGYIDDTLLNRKLEACGEQGQEVYRASAVIAEAGKASAAAHRCILYALFVSIFGECSRVVTSEELASAGFDDSREPDMVNYYDYL
jgi:hypothetical protein